MRVTYHEGSTPLHRLNPITKLVILLAFCMLAIFGRGLQVQGTGLAVSLLLLLSTGAAYAGLRGVRSLIFICLILFLLQAIFVKTGRPLAGFEESYLGMNVRFVLTSGGLVAGTRISMRLLTIIFSSLIFVITTDPAKLAYSMMQAGVPYRYGFMLVLALRFIPVFQAEASTVRRAQAARGLRVDSAGPLGLMRLARYTFTPLLVSTLSRVETISSSMEARGFGISRDRTYLRDSNFEVIDWIISISSVALLTIGLMVTS
jgi:energy-coupling factor transport system permease protein